MPCAAVIHAGAADLRQVGGIQTTRNAGQGCPKNRKSRHQRQRVQPRTSSTAGAVISPITTVRGVRAKPQSPGRGKPWRRKGLRLGARAPSKSLGLNIEGDEVLMYIPEVQKSFAFLPGTPDATYSRRETSPS